VPASSHVAAQVAPPAQVAAPSAPVAPAQSAPAGSVSGQDVLAPLAGVVDSIDVRVGQAVNAGDRVAVIEAMKMKTDVFSKTSGTIKSIFVKIKDSVDTDQPILNIG
jgi:biotin carboxyl carrier protein